MYLAQQILDLAGDLCHEVDQDGNSVLAVFISECKNEEEDGALELFRILYQKVRED